MQNRHKQQPYLSGRLAQPGCIALARHALHVQLGSAAKLGPAASALSNRESLSRQDDRVMDRLPGAHRVPVSVSVRKMLPSLLVEYALLSSAVRATAVTARLREPLLASWRCAQPMAERLSTHQWQRSTLPWCSAPAALAKSFCSLMRSAISLFTVPAACKLACSARPACSLQQYAFAHTSSACCCSLADSIWAGVWPSSSVYATAQTVR